MIDQDAQTAFVIANAGKLTDKRMAERLGITYRQVRSIRERLKLTSAKPHWTAEEIDRLRELHRRHVCARDIAKDLGRSFHSVKNQLKTRRLAEPAPHGSYIKPEVSAAPYAPDSSTPKFADDEKHLALVLEARPRGFPAVFTRPHYRVRAA